jgi:hypothetical protein
LHRWLALVTPNLCLKGLPAVPVKNETSQLLSPSAESGIVELSLMLSRLQFEALEHRAGGEGLSVAQFLRRLVNESISPDLVMA